MTRRRREQLRYNFVNNNLCLGLLCREVALRGRSRLNKLDFILPKSIFQSRGKKISLYHSSE